MWRAYIDLKADVEVFARTKASARKLMQDTLDDMAEAIDEDLAWSDDDTVYHKLEPGDVLINFHPPTWR